MHVLKIILSCFLLKLFCYLYCLCVCVCVCEGRHREIEIKDTHPSFQQTWSAHHVLGVILDAGTQRWREGINTFNKRHGSSTNSSRERGIFRDGLESAGQHKYESHYSLLLHRCLTVTHVNVSMASPITHLTDTFPCETHAGFFFLIHHGEFQTASKNPYAVMASVVTNPSQGG